MDFYWSTGCVLCPPLATLTSGSHSAMASPRSESRPPVYECSILFLAPSCGEGMCCTHMSTKPVEKRKSHA